MFLFSRFLSNFRYFLYKIEVTVKRWEIATPFAKHFMLLSRFLNKKGVVFHTLLYSWSNQRCFRDESAFSSAENIKQQNQFSNLPHTTTLLPLTLQNYAVIHYNLWSRIPSLLCFNRKLWENIGPQVQTSSWCYQSIEKIAVRPIPKPNIFELITFAGCVYRIKSPSRKCSALWDKKFSKRKNEYASFLFGKSNIFQKQRVINGYYEPFWQTVPIRTISGRLIYCFLGIDPC